MAFQKTVELTNCPYVYEIDDRIRKYTLLDNTFMQTKLGHYELTRLLEKVPNSNEGFLLKIIINKDLTGFKINITDQSGLRLVDIFKKEEHQMIREKFYFLMTSLVERHIFKQIDK